MNFTHMTFNLGLWKPHMEDVAVCIKSNGSSSLACENQT